MRDVRRPPASFDTYLLHSDKFSSILSGSSWLNHRHAMKTTKKEKAQIHHDLDQWSRQKLCDLVSKHVHTDSSTHSSVLEEVAKIDQEHEMIILRA